MEKLEMGKIKVGVVGIGLMGSSIIASFLLSGHPVVALAPIEDDLYNARERIIGQLQHSESSGMLKKSVGDYLSNLTISKDYLDLDGCLLVMECVVEIIEIKQLVYKKITDVVSPDTVIASNTSAIPISSLQKLVEYPERFLGIHWAEPAYLTRFMEITCGEQTKIVYAKWVLEISKFWGKEATLLLKDIRGFITNRLMYAVYREALYLIQQQKATMEDVDKAFRFDVGSWITLMGIYRRMDFLGLKDFSIILEKLYPQLCNEESVPPLMQEMVRIKARGIHNLKGLFPYSEKEAKDWEKAFAEFNRDIFKLAAKYPVNI